MDEQQTEQQMEQQDTVTQRVSEFAVASLVLGILSFLNLANLDKIVLAVVFGILALRRIERTGDRGRGLAMTGITLAVIAGVLLSVFLVRYWPQIQAQIQRAATQQQR